MIGIPATLYRPGAGVNATGTRRYNAHRARRRPPVLYDPGRLRVALIGALLGTVVACGPDGEQRRLAGTSRGTYDPETGVLRGITYDRNGNGRIDTWTRMEGGRPVSSELDTNEDGVIDRWEEYDEQGRLARAGWIRPRPPVPATVPPDGGDPPPPAAPTPPPGPDSWLYPSSDGRTSRIDFLDTDNAGRAVVTRREFYEGEQKMRVEEDKDGDDRMDMWETWVNGVLASVEFDEGHDGRPDRRFTYDATGSRVVLIESEPDADGVYRRRVTPGGR